MNKRRLREQMQQLQRPTKEKRSERPPMDESSLLIRQPELEEIGQNECEFEDNEDDRMPVQFSFGKTQKGGKCLWFGGFRYIRKYKNHFRCSNFDCKRKAVIDYAEGEHAVGRLLGPAHNHVAERSRKDAEMARHEMKEQIVEKNGPRVVPSKVLPLAREKLNDEAFFIAGSDDALTRMMRREKAKVFTNLNLRNPLLVELPDQLTIHKGLSMLLYDSRVERPGQSDTVLVFSHPNLLHILRSNLKFAVDGTFRAAPSPWMQLWVIGCFVKRRIVIETDVHDAFAPELNNSYPTSTTLSTQRSYVDMDYPNNGSILFGRPSPIPSTPTMDDDHNYGQHIWTLPIVRRPQYEIDFWNVHHRALTSIEKTNNSMEAAHQQFAKGLNHHPSLSDLLFALLEDIDKQCDIARSAQAFKHVRRKRYVIQEERLMNTLNQAEYDTNEDLRRILTLIGLQLQGFVAGIRVRDFGDEREVETEGSGMTTYDSDMNSF